MHDFSVWLRTGFNPPYINRFQSDTANMINYLKSFQFQMLNIDVSNLNCYHKGIMTNLPRNHYMEKVRAGKFSQNVYEKEKF